MGRAHADYAVLAPPPEHSNTRRLRRVQLLKRVLDCLISALALAAAALALHGIDSTSKLPFKTFAPPSLSSAIIFFGGPSPPPVRGFLLCTIGAWLVGAAITTASPLFGPDNDTRAILSAATLFYFVRTLLGSLSVVTTPPNEHTSEGGRDDRGVPYHAESTLSSAQVLKSEKGTWSTWSAVINRTSRAGELRSAPSGPDDWHRVTG